MKIVFYGLTITSAWGNGHATTYRSLLRALARRGHTIHFVEKDVEWYRSNRDLPDPAFCSLHLYENWSLNSASLLHLCSDADALVIGSYFPDAKVASCALIERDYGPILFYDIDTPITLAQLREHGKTEYLDTSLIPQYSAYLSFTGGGALAELITVFGAQCAFPLYCSVDPDFYAPNFGKHKFASDLSYLGTYAADRQPKLMRFLNRPAELLPEQTFLVAGAMYPDNLCWSANVKRLVHVYPASHPDFYSSSRFTLNLTRDDMVAAGYSPSVRLFEASACGATILSDDWDGLGNFLTPGEQIVLPRSEQDVTDILLHLTEAERIQIGRNARERILAEHTSEHRAMEFEAIISGLRHSFRPDKRAL